METSIVIALITVGIPGIISLLLQLKKHKSEEKLTDADVTQKISEAFDVLTEQLREQNRDLKAEIGDVKKQVQRLKIGVNKLIDQIRARGEVPCWTPDEEDL